MKSWKVQDAKARFSELLDECAQNGPQLVTKRGVETAVLVSMREWQRLSDVANPTLKELLLSDTARMEFALPWRGERTRRASVVLA